MRRDSKCAVEMQGGFILEPTTWPLLNVSTRALRGRGRQPVASHFKTANKAETLEKNNDDTFQGSGDPTFPRGLAAALAPFAPFVTSSVLPFGTKNAASVWLKKKEWSTNPSVIRMWCHHVVFGFWKRFAKNSQFSLRTNAKLNGGPSPPFAFSSPGLIAWWII